MKTKEQVFNLIKSEKVLVIVRGAKTEKLIRLFDGLYRGGINVAEITFGTQPDEIIYDRLCTVISEFGDRMCLGAGTVTTAKRAELAIKAGANFLVSPVFGEDVASICKKAGVLYIAGAFTPTEIKCAYDGGADIVKLFPAGQLGAGYLKAVLAPLCGTPIMAFGGINKQNAVEFIRAGAIGVGVGADVVDEKMLESDDYLGIQIKAKEFILAVK